MRRTRLSARVSHFGSLLNISPRASCEPGTGGGRDLAPALEKLGAERGAWQAGRRPTAKQPLPRWKHPADKNVTQGQPAFAEKNRVGQGDRGRARVTNIPPPPRVLTSQGSGTTPGYFLLGLHVRHTSAGLGDNAQSPRLRGQLRARELPVAKQRGSLCSVPGQRSKYVPCSYPQFTGRNSPLPAKKTEPQPAPPRERGSWNTRPAVLRASTGGGWQAPVGPAGRPVLFSFLQQSPVGLASSPAEKLPSRPPPLPGVACEGRNNGCTWVR